MMYENDNFTEEENKDRREICLSREFLEPNVRQNQQVWSYRFAVKDVDDFIISVPNNFNDMEQLKDQKKGWQERPDKFFVRVTISPSPENDATIFITFSYPSNLPNIIFISFIVYPEYLMYNDTDFKLRVQHRS